MVARREQALRAGRTHGKPGSHPSVNAAVRLVGLDAAGRVAAHGVVRGDTQPTAYIELASVTSLAIIAVDMLSKGTKQHEKRLTFLALARQQQAGLKLGI